MTALDSFDRYDIAMYLFLGVCVDAALILSAPLWAIVLIVFAGCVAGFIRHFDEIMFPDDRDPAARTKDTKTH